jgi:multimeric flavodoxin WrbA
MFVLGLQGSPRRKGNSAFLLSAVMEEAKHLGARTETIEVDRENILPCKEYVVCEKKGFCPIDDYMKQRGYTLLRRADVIVAASPIFFYNCTAQLKALIDRSQTLWARRYRLKLSDPKAKSRRGFALSVAATHGKQLFEGLHLTMQYFFDAASARYHGSLTYRGIEKAGDMAKHPKVHEDVADAVKDLLSPFLHRRRLLFVSAEDAARSQMAAAFAQIHAGARWDVCCAGIRPAEKILPAAVGTMRQRGIDIGFLRPEPLSPVIEGWTPEAVVTFRAVDGLPDFEGARTEAWNLACPGSEDVQGWQDLSEEIKQRVEKLTDSL